MLFVKTTVLEASHKDAWMRERPEKDESLEVGNLSRWRGRLLGRPTSPERGIQYALWQFLFVRRACTGSLHLATGQAH
jgi:hypothetical protein